VVPEVLDAEKPAFTKAEHDRELQVGASADTANTAPNGPNQDMVGGIEKITARLHDVALPELASLAELAHHRFVADEGPGSGQPGGFRRMTSGCRSSLKVSISPAFHVLNPARTLSTFSCDTGYSESPTAWKASSTE
jgi:hypothetical protein